MGGQSWPLAVFSEANGVSAQQEKRGGTVTYRRLVLGQGELHGVAHEYRERLVALEWAKFQQVTPDYVKIQGVYLRRCSHQPRCQKLGAGSSVAFSPFLQTEGMVHWSPNWGRARKLTSAGAGPVGNCLCSLVVGSHGEKGLGPVIGTLSWLSCCSRSH